MKLEDIKIGDSFKTKYNGLVFTITDIFYSETTGYHYLKYKQPNGIEGKMNYGFFKGLPLKKIKKEN